MKMIYEVIALILFFVAYQVYGIYTAIAVAMAAYAAQVLHAYLKYKQVEKIQLITLLLIVVLGGATLVFRNELFFKWKPTIVYWLFAVLLASSQVFGSKTLLQRMGENVIRLPNDIWPRLNMSWAIFFTAMGIINLTIAYQFSTTHWVYFKIFGAIGLIITFVLAQYFILSKHIRFNDQHE